jgi:hypothetical protein
MAAQRLERVLAEPVKPERPGVRGRGRELEHERRGVRPGAAQHVELAMVDVLELHAEVGEVLAGDEDRAAERAFEVVVDRAEPPGVADPFRQGTLGERGRWPQGVVVREVTG